MGNLDSDAELEIISNEGRFTAGGEIGGFILNGDGTSDRFSYVGLGDFE